MTGPQSFAQRLREGERLLAASATISPIAAEILGRCGFDWLFIDAEAIPLTAPDIRALIRAAEGTGAAPVVRTNDDNPADIRQILDMGAAGVIIPLVGTAAQTRSIVDAARFAPLGVRGVTAGRAQGYGYASNVADYLQRANDETAVIVMIEDSAGLENVAEIAAVDGLDGLFVGPGDLAISLGCPGQPLHADMRAAYAAISAAARSNGIALGTFPANREMHDLCHDLGFSFFLAGLDTQLLGMAASTKLGDMKTW